MKNNAAARALATISILGLITAVVATVIGHIGLGPGYNPLKLTISDYALSNRGVTIEIAMVALAAVGVALLAGLRAVGVTVRGLLAALLSVWSVGLLISAVIPTDPLDVTVMSTAATIHRYASVAAFVSLPIAAAVIASRFTGLSRRAVAAVRWLCVTCAAGLALLWYVAFPGGRTMMGLVERGLVGIEVAILVILSIGILRATRTGITATSPRTATTAAVAESAATANRPATAGTSLVTATSTALGGHRLNRLPAERVLVGAVSAPAHRGSRDA